jgi:hypothetical protein
MLPVLVTLDGSSFVSEVVVLWVLITIIMFLIVMVTSLYAAVNKLTLAVDNMAIPSTLGPSSSIGSLAPLPFPRKQFDGKYEIQYLQLLVWVLGYILQVHIFIHITEMTKQRAAFRGCAKNSSFHGLEALQH